MNIAQVCIRYLAPGGVETHIQKISERLVQRGHHVTVYTTNLKTQVPWQCFEDYDAESCVNGVRIIRLPVKGYPFPYAAYPTIPGLIKTISNAGDDVVHAHSHRYYQVFACAAAKLKRGRHNGQYQMPLVVTPHFHPPSNLESPAARLVMGLEDVLFSRRVYRMVDRVLVVTDSEKPFIRRFVPLAKCVTVPNGLDIEEWTPIPSGRSFRRRYKIGDDEKMILYTGRLADNKGLEHLIDASFDVVAAYPDTKFVIVGEDWGVLKRLKKKIWANNLDDYFVFTGHIESYELFKSGYAAANVFVLPSEWEAFGIVLLEAMACGTPIVASDVGGIPEVVGGIGRIFKYGDTRALAENLIEILDNEQQEREKSIRGREKVIEQFTWNAVVDRLEEVYKSLLDAN
ncbi:MAG TPA: glycosyltransferase family 4 protein [Candidatus Bathyarchaeia archaeon]|nr:glycosyltransferase family 4 protein [Candidatus Bathyarchaeia archaeon]